MSFPDVSLREMSSSFDQDDLARLGGMFAEDLRSAFPAVELQEPVVQDHLAAMMLAAQLLADPGASVPEAASHPSPEGLTTPRRTRMRTKLTKRLVAVGAALSLTLGGLAVASALEGGGSDDPGDDATTVVAPVADDLPTLTADDQGDNADEQGDATDDQGGDKQSDDQGDQADVSDQAGDVQSDDQGEDGDDQGENEDDQGEDDQGAEAPETESSDDEKGEGEDEGGED